jgi:hypothetical protein
MASKRKSDLRRNRRLDAEAGSDSRGGAGGKRADVSGGFEEWKKRKYRDTSSYLDTSSGLVEVADDLFQHGNREDAHALGAALEASRAEEKRAAQGGGSAQQSLLALPLLRKAEQDLGPPSVLDALVPGLRALNQRVVVLEDKQKRLDIFKCWFTNYDLACTKVIREGVSLLLEKQADFLFLDFDIHDPGDRTLREWLNVPSGRKELDGLDLAYYVAKRLPVEKRPKNIIIHSRNPVGRRLMREYLEKRELKPVMWAFQYGYRGPDETAPAPVLPPKPSPKPVSEYARQSWLEAYDDAKGWSGL